MRVILLKEVENLGTPGELKEVKGGYGKNFLLPNGLAMLATQESLKKMALFMKRQGEFREQEKAANKVLAEKLNGLELEIKALANEQGELYGSVGVKEVGEALENRGFKIKEKYIKLKDNIKKTGEYKVLIDFDHQSRAEILVKVI